ncbi:MAG: glycoside hydrolase family 130 protein [Spirochaetes bacterium]|nr:glycoside hydrolase family 130 protein [Spirochaetota bacterium]
MYDAVSFVKRLPLMLKPDASRVLIRPFMMDGEARIQRIIARVMMLAESEVEAMLAKVVGDFEDRHHELRHMLSRRFTEIRRYLYTDGDISDVRKMLIASYFTMEYSIESAALFNPSIVAHPDQSGADEGGIRFILSLRATGEGHLSSITFRDGFIGPDGGVRIIPPTRFVTEPEYVGVKIYNKGLFRRKLREIGCENDVSDLVLKPLPEQFYLVDLKRQIDAVQRETGSLRKDIHTTAMSMVGLAESNYEVQFGESSISERIIFPNSPSQRRGIEDARFVRFADDDGTVTYYATYTAYDGSITLPQILETRDFLHFTFSTLNGPAVRNKGMALFPRRINGMYTMLARQDNEHIFLMYSDNIHFWYDPKVIIKPTFPWEYVQMGNCGSPIELEEGWLVLTHGVGPMRQYCIGALLLDRNDPSKVRARLAEPLIRPVGTERDGYVPNVAYTCGALLSGDTLIIPYAISDYATGFASVNVHSLLEAMR